MCLSKQDHFKVYCQREFYELIKKIASKKQWNISNLLELFSNGFSINRLENIDVNCDRLCYAMVPNGDDYRRCTRKKKFGELCGLHYNQEIRKGSDIEKYKINNFSFKESTFYISAYENNSINNINECNSIINNSFTTSTNISTKLDCSILDNSSDDEYDDYDEEHWDTIIWGHRQLLLHIHTNLVYTEMVEGRVIIGKYDSITNKIVDVN